MRVVNHNWSATKQRLHLQSVAEISRHSQFCQGTGFDNVRHRLGLTIRTQLSVCKSPFPSAGTAVSLFHAKTVQQRPLLPREVETRCWIVDKGKGKCIYIALIFVLRARHSGHHTVLPAITPMPAFGSYNRFELTT